MNEQSTFGDVVDVLALNFDAINICWAGANFDGGYASSVSIGGKYPLTDFQ